MESKAYGVWKRTSTQLWFARRAAQLATDDQKSRLDRATEMGRCSWLRVAICASENVFVFDSELNNAKMICEIWVFLIRAVQKCVRRISVNLVDLEIF